jgi:branched-chain amino acid transport system substrate-binding protein
MLSKLITSVSLVTIMAFVGSACTNKAKSSDQSAIKVGAVSSLTGPAPFPESSAAAKAVFDRVNAAGGVAGRKIDYKVEDDKADPQLAAQASRRLVDTEGVVAHVASASLLECSVNAAYYQKVGLRSIQGTGVDPICFNASSISPVNTGPYSGVTMSLYFASEVLKRDRICLIYFNVVGVDAAVQAAIDRWKAISGRQLTLQDQTLKLTDDLTPMVIRAKQAGCQAIAIGGLEPHAIAWAKAAKTQGLAADLIELTSAYTDRVASTLGEAGIDGLYANAEFEPFGNSSPALADWRELMTGAHVPLTSFAEGGYVAAMAFVEALKGIRGAITRESVTKALDSFTGYKTDMMGSPYSFGPGKAHNPNQSSKFVQVKGGKWTVVTQDWVRLPS